MFNKIFEKTEMYDVTIYWDANVNCEDLVNDLEIISERVLMANMVKDVSRIVVVRNNWMIDNTKYKTAELHCNKMAMKMIGCLMRNNGFKAVRFMKTSV